MPYTVSRVPPPADPNSGEMAVIAGPIVKLRLPYARPTPGTLTETASVPGGPSVTLQVMCTLDDA